MLKTKSGLSRNKCYRVSLAEKVVIPAGKRSREVPKGSWMVESLSKPPVCDDRLEFCGRMQRQGHTRGV